MIGSLQFGTLTSLMPAEWIPADTPIEVQRAISRARCDLVRVIEDPPGSNRGPEVDAMNTAVGSPLGSYWCGSAVASWWREGGIPVPQAAGAVASWISWAKLTKRWSEEPVLGAAVVYQFKTGAHHIGLVCRLTPLIISVEGNTTLDSTIDRNGVAVAMKVVDPRYDPILGYVLPFPRKP